MTINQKYFEAKFSVMSDEGLAFSSRDVREVLTIWRDDKPMDDPYMVKCWAEFDAITAERQRRAAK